MIGAALDASGGTVAGAGVEACSSAGGGGCGARTRKLPARRTARKASVSTTMAVTINRERRGARRGMPSLPADAPLAGQAQREVHGGQHHDQQRRTDAEYQQVLAAGASPQHFARHRGEHDHEDDYGEELAEA